MSAELKLTENPFIAQAEVAQAEVAQAEVAQAEDLEKAKTIYNGLQEDIQKMLIEEYINPQLRGDDLVKEFDKQLMSEECSQLEWQVLTDVVSKIIENKLALEQMFEKYEDDVGFKTSYINHFEKNIMAFSHPSWTPLTSMCAELTMRKWH
jgi:hypothetical protein